MKFSTHYFAAFLVVLLFSGASAASEIASYTVKDGAISASLTGKPGNAEAGLKAFLNRKQGNCLACHQVSSLAEHPFHGEIGPSLDGVAERYSVGALRLQIVNPKEINPDTIMPAFYKTEGLNRVLKKFKGKSVLTAEQVEDILAYIQTFK